MKGVNLSVDASAVIVGGGLVLLAGAWLFRKQIASKVVQDVVKPAVSFEDDEGNFQLPFLFRPFAIPRALYNIWQGE